MSENKPMTDEELAQMREDKENEKLKCVCCEQEVPRKDMTNTDAGDNICLTCFDEAEPIATVIYDDHKDDPVRITEYHNPTPFVIAYHRTDGWRGYYEVTGHKGWAHVHDDNILSHSEDSKDLKSFNDKIQLFCKTEGIETAVIICRSSNLFSSGYDFFVKEHKAAEVMEFIKGLKNSGMRDPVKYNSEAITGVPYSQQTEKDKQLVLAAALVKSGVTPEQAVGTLKILSKVANLGKEKLPSKQAKKGKKRSS
ncbi:Uncharacterised protein [Candidatus Anstonella stagnisolia]|nr:Uncharacterised protein [Candidatus Anstonella stagnisolia]